MIRFALLILLALTLVSCGKDCITNPKPADPPAPIEESEENDDDEEDDDGD